MNEPILPIELVAAVRNQAIVSLVVGLVSLVVGAVLGLVARNSLKLVVRSVSNGTADSVQQAKNASRVVTAYLLFGLMLGFLTVSAIHLGSADNWLALMDPRSVAILQARPK